ncbi:MAG: hypothetical protein II160_04740 [Selenomonas sp.]|jgi:hypothetical protein|nr:hypothetical protein [Selenomonas sp.]
MKGYIYARGRKWDEDMEIDIRSRTLKDITILLNGHEHPAIRDWLDADCLTSPPMGGTFYPEPGTMLGYYNALQHAFFDELYEIKVEGKIGTIPYKPGRIY